MSRTDMLLRLTSRLTVRRDALRKDSAAALAVCERFPKRPGLEMTPMRRSTPRMKRSRLSSP